MGLGKTGEGITAPLPLVVKQNRTGVGLEAEQERVAVAKIRHIQQVRMYVCIFFGFYVIVCVRVCARMCVCARVCVFVKQSHRYGP